MRPHSCDTYKAQQTGYREHEQEEYGTGVIYLRFCQPIYFIVCSTNPSVYGLDGVDPQRNFY